MSTTWNTRIQNLYDSSDNWIRANDKIPLRGELVVYETDNVYKTAETTENIGPCIKIGDGTTVLKNLTFVRDTVLTEEFNRFSESTSESLNDINSEIQDLHDSLESLGGDVEDTNNSNNSSFTEVRDNIADLQQTVDDILDGQEVVARATVADGAPKSNVSGGVRTFVFGNQDGFGADGADSFIKVWNDDGKNTAIVPSERNKQKLGAFEHEWADVYATRIHGDLDGNAKTATSATYATGAKTSAQADDPDDGKHGIATFTFGNTDGFGVRGLTGGFIRIWSQEGSNGEYHTALVPSVNGEQKLGLSNYRWSDVYANKFHGDLDGTATNATYADRPKGDGSGKNVFPFVNTDGFGVSGSSGFIHVWNWGNETDGYYSSLMPSVNGKGFLGASNHRWQQVYANHMYAKQFELEAVWKPSAVPVELNSAEGDKTLAELPLTVASDNDLLIFEFALYTRRISEGDAKFLQKMRSRPICVNLPDSSADYALCWAQEQLWGTTVYIRRQGTDIVMYADDPNPFGDLRWHIHLTGIYKA